MLSPPAPFLRRARARPVAAHARPLGTLGLVRCEPRAGMRTQVFLGDEQFNDITGKDDMWRWIDERFATPHSYNSIVSNRTQECVPS